MRIALLYNARPTAIADGLPDDWYEEYDSPGTIEAIAAALGDLGTVTTVAFDRHLPSKLEEGRYGFVFNIAEGEGRRSREAVPAAVCELLGIPYTGSDPVTLGLTLDKWLSRRVVSPDVAVARAVRIEGEADEASLASLTYPVIVKPNDEGSSKGIDRGSLLHDASAAAGRCRLLREHYGCPALAEEFLPGPEVTVAIVGNGRCARLLGMMEIEPLDRSAPFVYSVEVKRDWRRRVRYHVPPRFDGATRAALEQSAMSAYHSLGCRDIARVDFRLDREGHPRFLECNPLPGLDPENSDVVLLARRQVPYERLVQGILLAAAERNGVAL